MTAEPAAASSSSPRAAVDASAEAGTKRFSIGKFLVRGALALVGLGLLYWCFLKAFGPGNREQLQKLKHAAPGQIAALIGLSLCSLVLNGGTFAACLRPLKRLPHLDVIATNAIASFLNYLPFKIGLVVRLAIHTRRDHIPVFTIGAWFAAVGVLLISSIGCLLLARIVVHEMGLVWVLVALGFLAVSGTIIVLCSRYFAGDEGLVHIREIGDGMARRLHVPLLSKIAASKPVAQLHGAGDILARPGIVAANMLMRSADIGLVGARVVIAGAILGKTVPYGEAFIVACTGFVVGIISLFGQVGPREAAMVYVAQKFDLPQPDVYAVVALMITATEAIAYACGGVLGAGWLWVSTVRGAKGEVAK